MAGTLAKTGDTLLQASTVTTNKCSAGYVLIPVSDCITLNGISESCLKLHMQVKHFYSHCLLIFFNPNILMKQPEK
jgi:hypothetical protein